MSVIDQSMIDQLKHWRETHYPESEVEDELWDKRIEGCTSNFVTADGERIIIIASIGDGVGICTSTKATADSLRNSLAVRQLTRLFQGEVSIVTGS